MAFITHEYKFDDSAIMTLMRLQQNEQKRKDQHTMAMRSLKKLIKPLWRLIKKKQLQKKTLAEMQEQNAYNSSLEDMRSDETAVNATNDNLANEALEERLLAQMRTCPENSAMIVQDADNNQHLMPINPEQQYIPVHFARTRSGTFFWTSMDVSREDELKMRARFDRWGQA